MKHEFYSNCYSKLVTPERTIEGTCFRSDEMMTHYRVSNSQGSFLAEDFDDDVSSTDTTTITP